MHDDDKRSSDPRIRDKTVGNDAYNNQIRNRKEKQNHIEDVPTYEGSKLDTKEDSNPINETQYPIKNGSNPRYSERKPNVPDMSRLPSSNQGDNKLSHQWPNALPVYTTTFRGKNANTNKNVNSVPTESGYNERERRSTENPSMSDVTRSSNIYNSVHGDNNYLF